MLKISHIIIIRNYKQCSYWLLNTGHCNYLFRNLIRLKKLSNQTRQYKSNFTYSRGTTTTISWNPFCYAWSAKEMAAGKRTGIAQLEI